MSIQYCTKQNGAVCLLSLEVLQVMLYLKERLYEMLKLHLKQRPICKLAFVNVCIKRGVCLCIESMQSLRRCEHLYLCASVFV